MKLVCIAILAAWTGTCLQAAEPVKKPDDPRVMTWGSTFPEDCPFPESDTWGGVATTGRFSDYFCGEAWFPSWGADGILYSPWTDGGTDGIGCSSDGGASACTGQAALIGEDPLNLTIRNTSLPVEADARPYQGRYPAGLLVHNGVWYYGTYSLGPSAAFLHNGFSWKWPNMGPFLGFRISRDNGGAAWTESPFTPEKPMFPEPRTYLGPVKMGAPRFVDFGRNMEHSPDGKAYLLAMGAEESDPKPRPCIRPGQAGEAFEVTNGCTHAFAHANLSWVTADQIYLARVKPSPQTINDPGSYEFFAGRDADGRPVWTNRFDAIKPLLEWNNRMGCVSATYVPGLKKYLMCVTDGWPTVSRMTSYILEADSLVGPWKRVACMKDFGEQGYYLNFPSKFISADGRTLWLCYSANFSQACNGLRLRIKPPGGRYGLSLLEVRLLPRKSN